MQLFKNRKIILSSLNQLTNMTADLICPVGHSLPIPEKKKDKEIDTKAQKEFTSKQRSPTRKKIKVIQQIVWRDWLTNLRGKGLRLLPSSKF